MLQKIYIKNYSIIEELTVAFDEKLNIMTGETGAGKSIILGALGLILGERADSSYVLNANEKSIIEASFDIKNNVAIQKIINDEDLDFEPNTVIRRELTANGKSRAFVNDTPVNLNILHKITSQLVDLHRQFDNLAIHDINFMYVVIDAVSQSQSEYKLYKEKYKSLKINKQRAEELLNTINQQRQTADYKNYLLEELVLANFKENEIEQAQQDLIKLENASDIINVLQTFHFVLEEQENAINHELKRQIQSLESIAKVNNQILPIIDRLKSCLIELKDIADESYVQQETVQSNPEIMFQIKECVDLGYKLLKKHQVNHTNDLIQIQNDLSKELHESDHLIAEYESLIHNISSDEIELKDLGMKIFEKRKLAIPDFEKAINAKLKLIGMPNADFKIDLIATEHFTEYGVDNLQFLIDTNNSGKYNPIHKTASGGELSRIMLSLKTHTAKALSLPTLIFDEVDTGISGEAAKQVGILLNDLGAHHQIICITHQVQVAAKGQHHLFVYKTNNEDGKIITQVKSLSKEEKITTIAQMIGGDTPTLSAINNAKELIGSL